MLATEAKRKLIIARRGVSSMLGPMRCSKRSAASGTDEEDDPLLDRRGRHVAQVSQCPVVDHLALAPALESPAHLVASPEMPRPRHCPFHERADSHRRRMGCSGLPLSARSGRHGEHDNAACAATRRNAVTPSGPSTGYEISPPAMRAALARRASNRA